MDNYSVGEYIIYRNGDRYELGRIKSLQEDGAFVAYHEGETGAKTPWDCMHKLTNAHCIKDTTFGGECFKQVSTIEPKQGEWIEDICKYDRAYHFKCSVCGEWNGLSVEEWNWTPNFCPNCGARMKGADDE